MPNHPPSDRCLSYIVNNFVRPRLGIGSGFERVGGGGGEVDLCDLTDSIMGRQTYMAEKRYLPTMLLADGYHYNELKRR